MDYNVGWSVRFTQFCAYMLFTNSIKVYYPVVLTLIAISFPYGTNEITLYLYTGRTSLTAAASGYILMMVTQFIWILLFGIQHEASVLRSFGDLNHYHNRVYSNGNHYHKDRQSVNSVVFGHNNTRDLTGPNYSVPVPTQANYATHINREQLASMPMYMSPPSQNTVFLSPHSEYSIPVIALHNYSANKEDPNELSFSKGELLHVHEKRGSWWQAKKANGSIGMVPSNYVTEQTSA
ncbi:unnamed protein product [Mucor hiemalis]